MKLYILEKIERHAPKLLGLVASYRLRPEDHTRAAIVNTILSAEVRYLDRDEILYLAWLKASYDHRMREEEEATRRRWLERQRRDQHVSAPRPHRQGMYRRVR